VALVRGVVTAFDELRGDGMVTSDAGAEFYFHCVALADGTRRIDVGTRVVGERRVGLTGSDEIAEIYSVGS
jgi:cold shock CspA family protein